MPENSLFLLFTRPLNQLGIRYMISGGAAVIIYGEPRMTHDVDLVVILDMEHAARLPEVFPSSEFYFPAPEVIRVEMARSVRGHFNIIHFSSGFKADIYLSGCDPLNAWGLSRARPLVMDGETIHIAPPEYVILRKLEYFREGGSDKHLRDIRSMLAASSEMMDRAELENKISERGLQAQWQTVLRHQEPPA